MALAFRDNIIDPLLRSLARMELSKITAAFFRRFDASIDPSMNAAEMRMYDTFNAGPAGGKLLLRLRQSDD